MRDRDRARATSARQERPPLLQCLRTRLRLLGCLASGKYLPSIGCRCPLILSLQHYRDSADHVYCVTCERVFATENGLRMVRCTVRHEGQSVKRQTAASIIATTPRTRTARPVSESSLLIAPFIRSVDDGLRNTRLTSCAALSGQRRPCLLRRLRETVRLRQRTEAGTLIVSLVLPELLD